MMSKGKKPPERSKIERAKPLAYQRRALDDARVVSEDKKPIEIDAKAPVEATEERATGEMTAVETPSEADAPQMPEAKASPAATIEAKVTTEATVEATPAPPEKKKAKDEPTRHARETIAMPVAVVVGAPPEVPGDVENPTRMPGPTDVPSGSPTDAAQAPGRVPSGDSRSLRRGADFALIYRQGSAVITRFGTVGTRGQWRVVEYPTPSSASNAYAKECSRFVGEGFSDYRD
jgi:hypothetical protein